MALEIRPYRESDLEGMRAIWNAIVEAGNAFPQVYPLSAEEAADFFAQQSLSAVAVVDDKVFGLYILHPNNVGRCAHVANASYGVAKASRGLGLGRELVKDSLAQAARLGFRGIQFNAVVASNAGAMHLYEELGFSRVGMIPGGFLNGYGAFEDMYIYYRDCKEWADGCACCSPLKAPDAADRVEGPAPVVAQAMPTELDLEAAQEILGETAVASETAVAGEADAAADASCEPGDAPIAEAAGRKQSKKPGKPKAKKKARKAEKAKSKHGKDKSKGKKGRK